DVILTLSDSVTSRLGRLGVPATTPSVTLFHPDLRYVERPAMLSLRADAPIKLLFLGRILHYKGLPLFLDAAQRLRDEGLAIEVGVFGEGDTSACTAQLQALDVELVNRWLTNAEIADALGRYHAVVLSHTSASQSGVVATAHGAGLPVVVTPVGGLLEQVEHGVTGLIAERADVSALTDSMRELCAPARYRELLRGVAASRTARSMPRFIRACVAAASGVDIRGEQ
ncbi:MAG: glycosyltransferase family 4 protein, partial [Gammaproteobacteria bacterium]|nr:glycosyltransferase family 4 protein [Gammaproteobacteria bacterium]